MPTLVLRDAMRRRFVRHLGTALGATVVGSPAFAQAVASGATGARRVLRIGIGLGPTSVQAAGVRRFAELVARRTNGALQVELHASGELGNDLSMVKALQSGTLGMTAPDSSVLASLIAPFAAINYPFTFSSETEADAILDGEWGRALLDKLPERGLVGLAYWENGFRDLTNSRHPVASPEDFVGLRIRTMQSPLLIDSFAHLGFKPVPLPFTQVYDAMRDQLVDGQENPLTTILSGRFYEVQRYLTLSHHVYSAHVLLIGGPTWQSLGEHERRALKVAAEEARDYERRLSRLSAGQALADLRAHGMQVTNFSRDEAERLRNRLRPVFDDYNRQIGIETMVALYVALARVRTAKPR